MKYAISKALLPVILFCSLTLHALTLMQAGKNADEAIRLRTELVLLEADVLNKKAAQAIGGLKKEDFIVYEDSVRQEITHFSQDKLPISVLILLDVSGSVWPDINELREAALKALRQLKPEDEVALMVFAGSTRLVQHFTRDKDLVARTMRSVGGKELEGGTNTNEAVYEAAAFLHGAANSDNRRIIIAITDDISTLKNPMPHSELETEHELLESGAIVCGLFFDSIYRTKRDEAMLHPDMPPATLINAAQDIIRAQVGRTGGISLEVRKGTLYTKFTELIQRLRTRYSFGYVPSNTKRDGRFRRIKLNISPDVEKKEGGIAIITRKGYYALRSDKSDSRQKQ